MKAAIFAYSFAKENRLRDEADSSDKKSVELHWISVNSSEADSFDKKSVAQCCDTVRSQFCRLSSVSSVYSLPSVGIPESLHFTVRDSFTGKV